MPKISKILELEITVEQFLNSCSPMELKELDLLIQSPRYQKLIAATEKSKIITIEQKKP